MNFLFEAAHYIENKSVLYTESGSNNQYPKASIQVQQDSSDQKTRGSLYQEMISVQTTHNTRSKRVLKVKKRSKMTHTGLAAATFVLFYSCLYTASPSGMIRRAYSIRLDSVDELTQKALCIFWTTNCAAQSNAINQLKRKCREHLFDLESHQKRVVKCVEKGYCLLEKVKI